MEENKFDTVKNGGSKNSIEEDIELLQDETSSLGLFFKCKGSEKYKIALEHILLDYKRVLKENEEYSKQLDLDYVDKNYISKKKIEDTIEELKGKLEDISRRREKSKTKEEETVLWCLEIRIDERIKTLQELL